MNVEVFCHRSHLASDITYRPLACVKKIIYLIQNSFRHRDSIKKIPQCISYDAPN
jgi:hypothetical protein